MHSSYFPWISINQKSIRIVPHNHSKFAIRTQWCMLCKLNRGQNKKIVFQPHCQHQDLTRKMEIQQMCNIVNTKMDNKRIRWELCEGFTFTGQANRKLLQIWNFSMSKSLTPQSLFEAKKCREPLQRRRHDTWLGWHSQLTIPWNQSNDLPAEKKVPRFLEYLQRISYTIVIICWFTTIAYSSTIQKLCSPGQQIGIRPWL